MAEEIESIARWKQKYYDSLEQAERKEKQWSEVEGLLRRCITRLTMVASGSDPDFNQQIETLRNAIRDGRDSLGLKNLIERLGDAVLRQDRQSGAGKSSGPEPGEVLLELLDALSFPRGMGRKVKALRMRLGDKDAKNDKALPKDFAELVREALTLAASEGAEETSEGRKAEQRSDTPKAGLFGRLFGKADDPAPAAVPELAEQRPAAAAPPVQPAKSGKVPDGVDLISRLLNSLILPASSQPRLVILKQQATADLVVSEWERLTDDIAALISASYRLQNQEAQPLEQPTPLALHEVLVQLLERLEITSQDVRIESLKTRLEQQVSDEELPVILETIADLVVDERTRVQREKQEIEGFLKQLTERLQDLDSQLQGSERVRVEALYGGRRLGEVIQAQVQGMASNVQEAADLGQLKLMIGERIEAIHQHLNEYRRAEEQRAEQAEHHVQTLTEKLQHMEHETSVLRSHLQEEHTLALLDSLTGIHNRLAYRERLEQEYARWKRYQTPLTLIVWDVDRFKKINDTYGHKSGDKALVTIAQLFKEQIRETDFLARYGGEEFVVLLPATPLDTAALVAEKLRAAIESCHFHFRDEDVPITISGGLAQCATDDTPETLFERADAAMYRAKRNGGNQCLEEEKKIA
ncbi:MAG TPA: diguanylate cyclase [Gammaproteobacteria bacterium]|nr:diguanylate cyclase [Gammaproteobacteria bacterium]